MTISDAGLAFLYIAVWGAIGFNFGRIARRYYREGTRGWPDGKSAYTLDWVLSMAWFVGSAFILGALDRAGDFEDFELLGPVMLIVAVAASLYRYRPR